MEVPKKLTATFQMDSVKTSVEMDYVLDDPTMKGPMVHKDEVDYQRKLVIECSQKCKELEERLAKKTLELHEAEKRLADSIDYSEYHSLRAEHRRVLATSGKIRSYLGDAVGFMKEAKKEFAPNTTNSHADKFIEWWESKGRYL